MNKQELIGHVADRAGLNRNDAVRAVETMLEVITSALKRGDEVRLVGFGSFSVTRRKPSIFARKDIHVHLPEGAVPKDGPSAGVGMVTAMISTLSGIAVRRDVAMTGEVTLRGRVLPIGGLKEKLLAALRGGITTVLIPAENEKDLVELPMTLKEGLEIIPVSHVDEVLALALTQPMTAIEWTDADELAAQPPVAGSPIDSAAEIRH